MPELLANPPWYVPSVVALIAVILLFQGNSRQNKNMKTAGLICSLIAAGILVMATVLESTHEALARKTREIAEAVDKRDWPKFSALLDPEVRFYFYNGRDQLTKGAEKSAEDIGVKDITIGNIEINEDANAYQVDFTATADLSIASRRAPTNWRFFWTRPTPDADFLLFRIDYVPDEKLGQDAISNRLSRP
ncbi:MAG: nuclear transport factor 2 family protein [Burkholderiales bacterium]|nr:nuclear transport factor 2 family protein [Phycisphaerae bacterium]